MIASTHIIGRVVALGLSLAALVLLLPRGAAATPGLADKSPEEIIRISNAAVGEIRNFQLDMRGTESGKRFRMKMSVVIPGRIRVEMTDEEDATARMILIDKAFYLSGDERYWRSVGSPKAAAKRLAGRWYRVPASGMKELKELRAFTQPKTFKRCMQEAVASADYGTLRKVGTAIVDGNPVVIIEDLGDRPGSAPGRTYISTRGRPLPVRSVQTGPQRQGGKTTTSKSCGGSEPDTMIVQECTARYDRSVRITAPKHAVDISKAGRQPTPKIL